MIKLESIRMSILKYILTRRFSIPMHLAVSFKQRPLFFPLPPYDSEYKIELSVYLAVL